MYIIDMAGYTLKRKCLHFDEIFITGCTESCQNDNFQCSQWWKFRQNDDFSFQCMHAIRDIAASLLANTRAISKRQNNKAVKHIPNETEFPLAKCMAGRGCPGDYLIVTFTVCNASTTISMCALGIPQPRAHSGYGLSQWKTTLHCNVVSHWLSPYRRSRWYLHTDWCVSRYWKKSLGHLIIHYGYNEESGSG